jgi:hypothetical protein
MDVEAEMGRFEQALAVEQEQHMLLNMPKSPISVQVAVAIDCLATCCLGMLRSFC